MLRQCCERAYVLGPHGDVERRAFKVLCSQESIPLARTLLNNDEPEPLHDMPLVSQRGILLNGKHQVLSTPKTRDMYQGRYPLF